MARGSILNMDICRRLLCLFVLASLFLLFAEDILALKNAMHPRLPSTTSLQSERHSNTLRNGVLEKRGGKLQDWVRRRFSGAEIESLVDRVMPKSDYYTKRDDFRKSEREFMENLKANGMWDVWNDSLGSQWSNMFPGRAFSRLDFVEWNQTIGFLNCNQALFLFPDLEAVLVKSAHPIDYYVFNASTNYGDLHYPITAPHAGEYDLIVFAQTLEHLYDPVLCLKNLFDSMKPGGYLFTSVPILNHIHMHPHFFSMPTPVGVAVWPTMAGFEVVKVGLFGNAQYVNNLGVNPTWWPKFRAYFKPDETPNVKNDPLTPVQGWFLARKPLK